MFHLFTHFVPPLHDDPTLKLYSSSTGVSNNTCHYTPGSWSGSQYSHDSLTHHYYDSTDLPPLPYEVLDVSNCFNSSTLPVVLGFFGFTNTQQLNNGFNSLGFDSSDYVHGLLFGRMPPISDNVPSVMDGFNLGSFAYFFLCFFVTLSVSFSLHV
ncbi:hypothetical protein NE237_013227 [Protea cynaroides]|uniref:Uncharacterized protein n=1 Tax=Protea cynaroides TaxID=273540 RepID=A0A9Q0GZH2_9MAGN|nr:hypothetical protein NE237_013227 [Protea cynaroides]